MTLLAVEPVRLGGPLADDGWEVYGFPPVCQHPSCSESWGLERHHVVRRSEIGRRLFVSIDGLVVANVVKLCKRHHDQVTGGIGGHKAMIRFPSVDQLEAGLYSAWWLWYATGPAAATAAPQLVTKAGAWNVVGPLKEVVCQ